MRTASHGQADFIAWPLAQQGAAQWRGTAEHLNRVTGLLQLHARALWAEKQPASLLLGVDQLYQGTQLDALSLVERTRAQLAPGDQRLPQLFDATRLTAGQIGRFQPQGVVLVFGDVLFVCRRFMGGDGGEGGLLEIALQMAEYVLQQQVLVHGVLSGSSG